MPYIGTTEERFENPTFVKAQFLSSLEQVKMFFDESGEELNLTVESFVKDYQESIEMWIGTWVEVPQDLEEPTETAMQMKAQKNKFVQLDGMGGHHVELVDIWIWRDSKGQTWMNEELFL